MTLINQPSSSAPVLCETSPVEHRDLHSNTPSFCHKATIRDSEACER